MGLTGEKIIGISYHFWENILYYRSKTKRKILCLHMSLCQLYSTRYCVKTISMYVCHTYFSLLHCSTGPDVFPLQVSGHLYKCYSTKSDLKIEIFDYIVAQLRLQNCEKSLIKILINYNCEIVLNADKKIDSR